MRTPACFLASILVLTASPVFAQTNVGSCDYLGEQHDGSWSFYTIDATSQGVSSDRAIRIHDNPTAVCGHDGAQNGAGFYCGETEVWTCLYVSVCRQHQSGTPKNDHCFSRSH